MNTAAANTAPDGGRSSSIGTIQDTAPKELGSVRIQFDMDADRVEELDAIMRKTGMKSRRELFDHALTLFEWAIGEVSKGRQVASVDESSNRYQVVVMPAFKAASRLSTARNGQLINGL